MVVDVVRGYVEVASGLTEVTRQRAVATARSLLSGGAGSVVVPGAIGQVGALADEILATSRANRELLVGLVRAEVDRAVQGLGVATQDDVAALRRQLERLADQVQRQGPPGPGGSPAPRTKKPAATKPATKKPAATKPATKKPAATKPATKKPAAAAPAAESEAAP